ncbi:MAG TPA: vitamin K epoxide reductase family protein [Vicinamibacterales bacterium]|nr:vitamin K epoxide reductase family protein [Vicinamibacterales bacterium]
MTKLSRTLLLAFAALGIGAASMSSYVHYQLLTDPSYSSFCDVNASVNCTQAYLSPYGSLFGVPVALFGVFFFTLVFLLAGVGGRAGSTVRDAISAYIFAISTVGLAFILYLGWASYVQLKTFCMLCTVTYVSVAAIFIVSGGATSFPMTTLPRRVPRDIRAFVSSPVALVLALLFVAGAGTVIASFPEEQAAHAAPPPLKTLNDQQRADLAKWWDLQPKLDSPIPMDGAKVMVVVFSDFQCPHCRAAHAAYKPIVAKYVGNSQVRFVLKHFPLEGECNSYAPGGSHSAACEAAAAVVLARQTGKADKMTDWLFDNQEKLTPSGVRAAAHDIGGIPDFNGAYAEALKEVRVDANLGGVVGVTSTPTVVLDNKKLPAGVVDPAALDALIDLELKRSK